MFPSIRYLLARRLLLFQCDNDSPERQSLQVNVDNADDICNELGIESMPTFVFAKNGTIVAKLEGADPNQLRKLVEKHK